MNSCNTDIFFSNYYHLPSVRFEFIIARIIALLDFTYGLIHIYHFVFTLICYSKCSNLRLPETRSRLRFLLLAIYTLNRNSGKKKKKTSPLFVPYNFDGNMLSSFVIKSFHHLSKGAFPQNLENFVSISKMIVQSFKIATILIIITC